MIETEAWLLPSDQHGSEASLVSHHVLSDAEIGLFSDEIVVNCAPAIVKCCDGAARGLEIVANTPCRNSGGGYTIVSFARIADRTNYEWFKNIGGGRPAG